MTEKYRKELKNNKKIEGKLCFYKNWIIALFLPILSAQPGFDLDFKPILKFLDLFT